MWMVTHTLVFSRRQCPWGIINRIGLQVACSDSAQAARRLGALRADPGQPSRAGRGFRMQSGSAVPRWSLFRVPLPAQLTAHCWAAWPTCLATLRGPNLIYGCRQSRPLCQICLEGSLPAARQAPCFGTWTDTRKTPSAKSSMFCAARGMRTIPQQKANS